MYHLPCVVLNAFKDMLRKHCEFQCFMHILLFLIFCFLSTCKFGGFSLSKLLIFFEYMQVLCTLGIKMLISFEYLQPTFLQPRNKNAEWIHLMCFSCLKISLMKNKFITYLQWTFINIKWSYINMKNGLTVAKHIVETQTLHWKQWTKSLDM